MLYFHGPTWALPEDTVYLHLGFHGVTVLFCRHYVGRKRARWADVHGVAGAIGQWPGIIWEPAYPVSRHLLGFNHPTTGEFLCPANHDWSDPK